MLLWGMLSWIWFFSSICDGSKWSLLMGIVGAVFGLIILSYPVVGAVTVSTLIGLYIVMFGILQLVEYYLTKDSYRIVIKEK